MTTSVTAARPASIHGSVLRGVVAAWLARAVGARWAPRAPAGAPQSWQNFAPGVSETPQTPHCASLTTAPHSVQKRPAAGVPQDGQGIERCGTGSRGISLGHSSRRVKATHSIASARLVGRMETLLAGEGLATALSRESVYKAERSRSALTFAPQSTTTTRPLDGKRFSATAARATAAAPSMSMCSTSIEWRIARAMSASGTSIH